MDPWCQLTTKHQKVRTRTLQGAGKAPSWQQAFEIKVYDLADQIEISVFDEDPMSDDVVS